ncbi:MAG: Lipopolysaccharide core biosynthesis protein RfaG [Phycisphaerae bacterium]|nr:Lipopolysaccharide core biosynthesis protein RfaG [Phycisphaerae bacterium]
MKVALVAEHVDPARGGAETSTLQFANQLADLGVDVHLYTSSNLNQGVGITVHPVKYPPQPRSQRTPAFIRAADELLHEFNGDLIHAITPCMMADIYQPRGGTYPETVERNLALWRYPLPRSLKRIANYFNSKQQEMLRIERALLNRTPPPMVLALSDYVVRQLQHHYHYPSERITKIFNGVDIPQFTPDRQADSTRRIRQLYQISPDQRIVVSVAQNKRLKGVHRWIEALAYLKYQGTCNIVALIIGQGHPRRWQRFARQLGVGKLVHFVGPTEKVVDFYLAADLLVHPTYYDPCSRVVLEALLCGVPAITTQYNGAAEVIEEGVTGRILAEPDDIVALAAAVKEQLAVNGHEALHQQRAALQLKLSMRRHAEEVFAAYQQMRSSRSR